MDLGPESSLLFTLLFLKGVVDDHPGLEFLRSSSEFIGCYMNTVRKRIALVFFFFFFFFFLSVPARGVLNSALKVWGCLSEAFGN